MYIVNALPDLCAQIVGVVPQSGGKCFDITLRSVDSATQLATAGFDYLNEVEPLRLLGDRTIDVSVFISVEFPNKDLASFLKQCTTVTRDMHISNAVFVSQNSYPSTEIFHVSW